MKFRRLTVHKDLALVRTENSEQDIHERRLTGAILAQQGVDLAFAHRKREAVIGHNARKSLDDSAHLHGIGSSRIGHRAPRVIRKRTATVYV